MFINMDVKSSYWEDSKQSMNIDNTSYNETEAVRKSRSTSPPIRPLHDGICKEENSIYQYCDRSFNFSANVVGGGTSEDDDYHASPKRKINVTRNSQNLMSPRSSRSTNSPNGSPGGKHDPMSHRIIEKRRRDRMNNCLADLSRLIPAEYLKKGRGRIEKTEIIEMAIKHMKFLQAQTCNSENCKNKVDNGQRVMITDKPYINGTRIQEPELSSQDHYKFGYQECLAETMHFLVELEGFFPSDTLCVKLISHLQKYYEKIAKGDRLVYQNPLENVSPTNTFEPKMNGYTTGSISELSERNGPNSVIAAMHSDDSCHDSGPVNSQLREMLVGPHLNSLYVPSMQPNIMRHSSPESPSPQTELMSTDTQSSNGSLYKFKNYIKERFSAEHSNSLSSTESKSPTPSVVVCTKSRPEYMDGPVHSPPSPDVKRMDDHYAVVSRPVPIFALHAKGSFYIPLTIESHLLTPFVGELNGDYGVSGFPPSVVLHPVTISVNFSRMQPKPTECKPLLSPNLISSRIPNGPLLIVPECR